MTLATPYETFLQGKRMTAVATGRHVEPEEIHPSLFPFQRDLTRWSLAKGRASLFADAGLGKTRMQLEWARLTGQRTLILAPLSVARQTMREARDALGMDVVYARNQAEAVTYQVVVTNYEMLHNFDPDAFGAVVLDESSILKATEGVYRNLLIDAFQQTPYRLCCTATPAPNDIQEITNHATFMGVMARRDVLATFFVHASEDARASGWRLKGHARPAFWRWLASWAMSLKRPSDLGYSDEGYELPPLSIEPVIAQTDIDPVPDRTGQGRLFMDRLHGVTDRAAVRKQTLTARVEAAAELITASPDEPWIAWRGLIAEGDALAHAIGDRAIVVTGPMSPEEKAERIEAFIDSPSAVLVTAPTIAGFGMNFQHCARMAFVGLGDSYEQYCGDSAEVMGGLADKSADFAVFSPPFQALYVYSPTERDLGNCRTPDEFFEHMDYITSNLARVVKPGRLVAVHCAQITAQKVLDGWIGLKDFRGQLIEHYGRHGFYFHREVCIDKDPQAQAIRTHSKALLFVQKNKDRSWIGPAIADYILLFRNGKDDPEVPINLDTPTDEEWIEWARPIWYGIRETDTLQAPQKGNDERHIAPLQLGTIERCIKLWTNPGETVLSPFAGIGSEGYEALRLGRRFVGIELKQGYFDAAVKNLRQAEEAGATARLL